MVRSRFFAVGADDEAVVYDKPPPSPAPPAPDTSPETSAKVVSEAAEPIETVETSAIAEEVAPPRRFLVFDTETTGLSGPLVVQLAYLEFGEDGEELARYNELLRVVPGRRIEAGAQAVHGISLADTEARGVAAEPALHAFLDACARAWMSGGKAIAHNAGYDIRAVNNTLRAWHDARIDAAGVDGVAGMEGMTGMAGMGLSAGPRAMDKTRVFCTMQQSKAHSPLLDRSNRRKAFKNAELYEHLFHRPATELGPLHDAMTDILVTKASFVEGARRGWW